MNRKKYKGDLMVVDDTPANLDLLVAFFSQAGFKVRALPNGRLALQAARIHPPELILLDINMPGLNGFEVCRQLKADPKLKDIPVIFISALNEPLDKVKAFGCGGIDYVSKPFHFEEVEARVTTHLSVRRLHASLEEERRRVQASYDQLHKLEGLRDLLVHMIIHDLRSPLHVVSLALAMLEGEKCSPEAQECLDSIRNASRHLTNLANTMLDLNKLEAGQMPLNRQPADLLTTAQAAAAELQFAARDRQLQIRFDGQTVMALMDEDLVRRMIVNFLSNAIKHAPPGSAVTVTVDCAGQQARLQVTDAGPGIPLEFQGMVFEKFGVAAIRQAGHPHSVGLGLAFCKLAAEAQQGRVGLDSQPGQGATFWFTLPLADGPAVE